MESTYCPVTRTYTDVYDANGRLVHSCVACDPHGGTCVLPNDTKVNGADFYWTSFYYERRPKPLTIDR